MILLVCSTWTRLFVSQCVWFPLHIGLTGCAKKLSRSMDSPSLKEPWLGFLCTCYTRIHAFGAHQSFSDQRGEWTKLLFFILLNALRRTFSFSIQLIKFCILRRVGDLKKRKDSQHKVHWIAVLELSVISRRLLQHMELHSKPYHKRYNMIDAQISIYTDTSRSHWLKSWAWKSM